MIRIVMEGTGPLRAWPGPLLGTQLGEDHIERVMKTKYS